jgi:hypothetical protein
LDIVHSPPRPIAGVGYLQGLSTSDCKTELCTRYILANSSIDRRAQPQIVVKRFAVLGLWPGLYLSHAYNRMRQGPVEAGESLMRRIAQRRLLVSFHNRYLNQLVRSV